LYGLANWIEPQIYQDYDETGKVLPSPHQPSPHQVLGVGLFASPDEIRKAYLKLAKAHHPDANQGTPKAAERFNDIVSAYSALKRKK
jgi:DnaJ-class molecular chaperone